MKTEIQVDEETAGGGDRGCFFAEGARRAAAASRENAGGAGIFHLCALAHKCPVRCCAAHGGGSPPLPQPPCKFKISPVSSTSCRVFLRALCSDKILPFPIKTHLLRGKCFKNIINVSCHQKNIHRILPEMKAPHRLHKDGSGHRTEDR